MRYIFMSCMLLAAISWAKASDAKAEDLIAQHLASIGTEEARAAVKSLAVQGTLRFKVIVGGAIETPGVWQRLSEERKSKFVMEFGDQMWWGEQFVFDGDKTSVATATLSHEWSALGAFVQGYDNIVKEGLLGGELGTAWALENIDSHHAKIENLNRKEIDGREMDELTYLSKSNNGMKIKLYFDPDTHHHVMTVYTLARVATIIHNSLKNARQKENRYTLEERFSDFQTDNNITLPRQYDLRFTQELQGGATTIYDWAMTADKVLQNPNIAATNFQVK